MKVAHPEVTPTLSLAEVKAAQQKAIAEQQKTIADVKAKFQELLNGNIQVKDDQGFSHSVSAAQAFFDLIHPIGTGKRITVLDAVLNKGENGNIQSVGLKLQLYWQGPLNTGSTVFQTLYDVSSDQYMNYRVISTDGITRQNIDDFANGYVIGAQIHDAFFSK